MAEGFRARARRWLGRLRAAPARVDRIHAEHGTLRSSLDEHAAVLRRIEELLVTRPEAVGAPESLEAELAALGAGVREEGLLTRVALAEGRRDEVAGSLAAEHAHHGPLRPGVSVFTITWNHAGYLEEAVDSGLAVLDGLHPDLRGDVLVLDDHSTDETPEVLARLTARDPRVRVIRAPLNLALSRARNVLLHACPTTHAFVLDSDNTAFPAGVAALFSVASRYDAAFTYGNVVKRTDDGSEFVPCSNEPPTAAWFVGNYIDSMALVDVATVRRLGGWTLDPLLHAYDDYELVHRLARRAELIAFVPTVVGRYRILPTSYIESVHDSRVPLQRLERAYRADHRLEPDDIPAMAAHPATGVVWATPAAVAVRPALADHETPAAPERVRRRAVRRALVVSSGGFRNVGDDAMAANAIRRLRREFAEIDLVTDGDLADDAGSGPGRCAWLGTLPELCRTLEPAAVEAGCDDPEVARRLLEVAEVGEGGDERPVAPVDLSDYSLVLLAGGGNLNSLWSGHMARRAALVAAARSAGVPVACSGQGLGPIEHDPDLRLLELVVDASERFGLRDPRSVIYLDVWERDVTVVGDDALGLPGLDPGSVDTSLREADVPPDRPFLALHARAAGYVGVGEETRRAFARSVDALAADRETSVVGVTMSDYPPESEAVTLARLAHGSEPRRAHWRVLECSGRAALAAETLGRADAALVHSYHAALFALERRVPALLFVASDYYRGKAEGLRQLAELPAEFVVDLGRTPCPGPAELSERLAAVEAAIRGRPAVFDVDRVDRFFADLAGVAGGPARLDR